MRGEDLAQNQLFIGRLINFMLTQPYNLGFLQRCRATKIMRLRAVTRCEFDKDSETGLLGHFSRTELMKLASVLTCIKAAYLCWLRAVSLTSFLSVCASLTIFVALH